MPWTPLQAFEPSLKGKLIRFKSFFNGENLNVLNNRNAAKNVQVPPGAVGICYSVTGGTIFIGFSKDLKTPPAFTVSPTSLAFTTKITINDIGKLEIDSVKSPGAYYLEDGTFVVRILNGEDVYIEGNPAKLSITYSQLIERAATVYGESSHNHNVNSKEEVYAIASVLKKNPKVLAYGKLGAAAEDLKHKKDLERNARFMKVAIGAVLNSVQNKMDYSNGASYWDGPEQSHVEDDTFKDAKYEYHINTMGWRISDDHYESWKKNISNNARFGSNYFKTPKEKYAPDNFGGYRNKDMIRRVSTAQHGLSIFWKEASIPKPKTP